MAEFTRGPANVDDILTTTLDKYRNKMTENWIASNAVTRKMMSSGNVAYEDGGNTIVEDIEYQDNDTAAFVDTTDTVSTAINQIATQAKYSWKMLAGTVGISDMDEAKNAGEAQMHKLISVRVKNLEETFKTRLETALVGGVTANIKTPWSLLDIIDASNPALGNLGDIDRSSYSWWSSTEAGSAGSVATGALDAIRTAYLTTSRGMTDPVGYHITTQTIWAAYSKTLQPQMIFKPTDDGDAEFTTLTFFNKPLFFSEGMSSGIWLGVNPKYVKMTINKNAQFVNKGFVRVPGGTSKSAVVELVLQITTNRPASLFKVSGLTA
jgi:hypothetical protein